MKPKFIAAKTLHIGGFGTAEDGSDIVREFAEGETVPGAEDLPTLQGLVVHGWLTPANKEAEALIEEV